MRERNRKQAVVGVLALFAALAICRAAGSSDAPVSFDEAIAALRYRVTAIEHGDADKVAAYEGMIADADALIKRAPERAEPLVWKGIALAAQAKYKKLGALSNVKEARALLEASLEIDSTVCDAAALNALGMLYHKVPGWPLAFGNDKTARAYFLRALSTSSNLDTNYRFGEFLADEGEEEEALAHLEKALSFPDRPGRGEDPLKKQEIRALVSKIKGK